MNRFFLAPLAAALVLGGVLLAAADAISTARAIAAAAARGNGAELAPHLATSLRAPNPHPLLALATARLGDNPPAFVIDLARTTADTLATPDGIARALAARLPLANRLPPEALLADIRFRLDGSFSVVLKNPWSEHPAAELRLALQIIPTPGWKVVAIAWHHGER